MARVNKDKYVILGTDSPSRDAYVEYCNQGDIIAFIEQDIEKCGGYLFGIHIISFCDLTDCEDVIFINTRYYEEGLSKHIKQLGFKGVISYGNDPFDEREKMIVYGAGQRANQLAKEKEHNIKIVSFVDKDENKWGRVINGIPVTDPSYITKNKYLPVVISVKNCSGIAAYVESLGAEIIYNYTPHFLLDIVKFGDQVREPKLYPFENLMQKPSINDLFTKLLKYDLISIDIYDTAVFRKVQHPKDVFKIIAKEIGNASYESNRINAENWARDKHDNTIGNREIGLEEIYNILEESFNIPKRIMKKEISTEIELCEANDYILQLYKRLIAAGKKIIFVSDMYLPKIVIEQILKKCSYDTYDRVYVSNEYGINKGNGDLQKRILADYPKNSVIHIGDNIVSDITQSQKVGMDTFAYHRIGFKYFERSFFSVNSLDQSFYRGIIFNNMLNGNWDKSIHYSHGFRVGGILSAGYCKHINRIAKENNVDKILFCSRDCFVIHDIYNKFYKKYNNNYIKISRYAILSISGKEYLQDFISRTIARYFSIFSDQKTIRQIFEVSGFAFLTKYLEEDDIEPNIFPIDIWKGTEWLRDFLIRHQNEIINHFSSGRIAAEQYFREIIGDSKRIIVADIGWTGTCITALRHFLTKICGLSELRIIGTLMCTSDSRELCFSVEEQTVFPYIYSPKKNRDLMDVLWPRGIPANRQEYLHMQLENLFTSTERSLMTYGSCYDSERFTYVNTIPKNPEEIHEMHKGMIDFVALFERETGGAFNSISPYTAFEPFAFSVNQKTYIDMVFHDYLYDAMTPPGIVGNKLYSHLDNSEYLLNSENEKEYQGAILFISPEMIYAGAPRSLLRMCKVAKNLGYRINVLTERDGDFSREYSAQGIQIQVVSPNKMKETAFLKEIMDQYDFVICNTIMTYKYVKLLHNIIPVLWYIREAANLSDFAKRIPEILATLKKKTEIICVSEYAKDAIRKYTDSCIKVVHNCIEDISYMATDHVAGKGDRIRFVSLGTVEYRKGYDVFIAAYKEMPHDYRDKSELYFAGGFIRSGSAFSSWIFENIENEERIHYLGLISDEAERIRMISDMDVVVVASRDESCSLVALEGAMLSKPLIVTENVGAKYMVDHHNGKVVRTDDVMELKKAMMYMIDQKDELKQMGAYSRDMYEKRASMDSYTNDLKKLFYEYKKKRTDYYNNRRISKPICPDNDGLKNEYNRNEKVVISLTSYPKRIFSAVWSIDSLLKQKYDDYEVILWLSEEQFPEKEKDLPSELLVFKKNEERFSIRWVQGDLKPHKKYFYAITEYPTCPIIIVDDDVIYEENLVSKLMLSYRQFPDCISCIQANQMMFRRNGELRQYNRWIMNFRGLIGIPSYSLLPVGVGGVLYPPGSVPQEAFDIEAIMNNCLMADDIWLKIMTSYNGYRTVLCSSKMEYTKITTTQDSALWKKNINLGGNDEAIKRILDYYDEHIGDSKELLYMIRKDRFR